MKETYFKYGNVEVKVIDKSSHEERKERLKKPLEIFFREVEREKQRNEKESIKTVGV